MKNLKILFLCIALFFAQGVLGQDAPKVLSLILDGTINPGTADFVISGIKKGEAEKFDAVLVNLNTPGGLLPSTQSIVEAFLDSAVPVIVYVNPSGGGAISAGVFITLAGHIASMAPGTNIGAAHPVSGSGKDIDGDMRLKAENFASSLIKAIAEQRGRNTAWAEKAVKESVALTDTEALKEKVIDFISPNVLELLKSIKGKKIKIKGEQRELVDLSSARIETHEMSLRQEVVSLVSDPSIASLLGVAAFGGIVAEFYHPGLIVPGTVGVLCLILTLVASQAIPINTGGVLLLVFGGILMIAEMFVPAFGVLGIVGLVCLVLGSVYVVDTSMIWAVDGFGLDTELVIGSSLIIGLLVLLLMYLAGSTFKKQVVTGREGLVGKFAEAKTDFLMDEGRNVLRGKVFIQGELWNAELQAGGEAPKKGAILKILELDGMVLKLVSK